MSHRDEYYNRAKQEGYRARSAYKLQQLDADADLFAEGDRVVDLGAAPGGWTQVAAERVGEAGLVVGVDRSSIDHVERGDARVDLLQGDVTTEETRAEIREALGVEPDAGPAVRTGGADVVISDMAPELSGEYDLDHARSVHLARQALETALAVLAPGGDVAIKVFDGRDREAFVADVDAEFEYAREMRPEASRDSSSELYVVGKGLLTAPVAEGDELAVSVTDEGSEGDGVARVEGYTLFVPGASPGDEPTVRVTDVKPRFGFAEVVDEDG